MRIIFLTTLLCGAIGHASTIGGGERASFYLQDANYAKMRNRACQTCPTTPNALSWTLTTDVSEGSLQTEVYTYDGTLYHSYSPRDIEQGWQTINGTTSEIGVISTDGNYIDVDWAALTTSGMFRFDVINAGMNPVSITNLWVQVIGQALTEDGILALTVGACNAPAYLALAPIQNEAPTPEPGAFGLLGLGLAGLVYYHRAYSA